MSRARFRVNPRSIVAWMSNQAWKPGLGTNQAWKFWQSGCHHYCSFHKITVTIIFATYRYHKWRLVETKIFFLCFRNIIIVATIIRFSGEKKFSGLQIISLFMPKGTKLCASNEKRLKMACWYRNRSWFDMRKNKHFNAWFLFPFPPKLFFFLSQQKFVWVT